MANATVSRLGQRNAAGATDAIFLEVFSGEVINKFDTAQITGGRHMERTIANGKSAQFPLTWSTTASYHTPGSEILGDAIKHNAKTIAIEALLEADVFVDKLDDAMNHYEVRSEYAHQLGQALANAKDQNVFRSIVSGSLASHLIDTSGDNDGTQLTDANMNATASVVKGAFYDAAQTLDEKNVPSDQRFAAVLPQIFYLLLEDGEFINRDFGGEGSKASGRLPRASDIEIHKSNNIPTADDSANAGVPSVLQADYTGTVACIWHTSGAGTVKLLDMNLESNYDIRRQGTLFVASYAIGQDYLRPESCVSLKDT